MKEFGRGYDARFRQSARRWLNPWPSAFHPQEYASWDAGWLLAEEDATAPMATVSLEPEVTHALRNAA